LILEDRAEVVIGYPPSVFLVECSQLTHKSIGRLDNLLFLDDQQCLLPLQNSIIVE
jgi:hypothetical protein